jgi:hypothetical protein
MSREPDTDQIEGNEPSAALPFPNLWWGRILYGLFITLLPAFSFWATDLLRPEWQNGELSSYLILLLFPEASLWFFPLLAYSIVCYLLLILRPARFSQSFAVRAGIYTGVLLALHYSIVVLIYSLASDIYAIVLIWIFPVVFSLAYRWAISKWTAVRVNKILLILISSGLLVGAVITRGSILALVFIAMIMAAPFWSFLLAWRAGIWLYKDYESRFTLPHGLGLGAWLATYVGAWRFDILKMYELYAALPPTPPPDCYIATAAAHGHPYFVRAWTVQRTDGKIVQVNKQLQLLKYAELALMAIHPRFHTPLRKFYDIVGKWLAPKIQNRFLADIAYLLLKPGEWLTGLLLKVIVPEIDSFVDKMYSK